jgi:hypothetical protein
MPYGLREFSIAVLQAFLHDACHRLQQVVHSAG